MQHKTRKKSHGGALVGKGAYGCVYRPAMRCHGNTTKRNRQITKYMSKFNALHEYNKRYILKDLDPHQEFFLYALELCRPAPNLDPKNRSNLAKCTASKNATHFLQIPDGGYSLFELRYPPAHPIAFLNSLHTLCKGVRLLHEHRIAHMDLKMHNAVIQPEDGMYRARWIDMGLLATFDELFRLPSREKIVYAQSYFIWPFETRFLASSLTYVTHKQLNAFYETVVRRINLTFPIPLIHYYTAEGQRHLTPRFVNEELIPLLQSIAESERIAFLAQKTDIYSLGMLLLKVTEVMLGSGNPFRPLCWKMMDIRPQRRPTAVEVCTQFEKLLGP
jgi:serine/threonine protein kinase